MYQSVTLVGHVGAEPVTRFTPTGVQVTTFNLAVGRTWTDQQGQKQEKTIWFRITCWRKTAEVVAQYVTKGMQVLVVGEIENANAYIDKEGSPRASIEIRGDVVRFLGSKDGASKNLNTAMPTSESAEQPSDIPF